jgi:hypothetical protein
VSDLAAALIVAVGEGKTMTGTPTDGDARHRPVPTPAHVPPGPTQHPSLVKQSPYAPPAQFAPYPPPPPDWVIAARPDEPPGGMLPVTGWAALAAALLAALLLGEGLGANLLFVGLPGAFAAWTAARAAGRRPRPWTLAWSAGCLALLAVPALRDADWPSTLAVVTALGVGSLALNGGTTWRSALLGVAGLLSAVAPGTRWAFRTVRERARGAGNRWGPVLRAVAVAVVLVLVFGALFAGADAAFADLLADLMPDVSVGESPLRLLFFVLALLGTLAAARLAAAPWRWDRIRVKPGRSFGRVEWSLPLVVLNVLFGVFNAVQLTVLFGGYDKVLAETGLTYSAYARQGFWQLLWATLLTLLVIALALRWAPRGRQHDRAVVRAVLGTLCVLTLVVVLSALRRMELYVDAYGLTRLRASVTGMEMWLGLVIVLLMAAGVVGGRWLPRAVAASAALGVLVFGLVSPDGLVASQNVARFERTGGIDLTYLDDLSADAVPALDRLPEPMRSCVLSDIAEDLEEDAGEPWFATSYGESRAREILTERPLRTGGAACRVVGENGGLDR